MRLHLVRKLISRNSRRQLVLIGSRRMMPFVHSPERVEHVALQRPRRAGGQRKIIDGRTFGTKCGTGVAGRHESAGPILRPVDRSARTTEHHDKSGQVVARRPEAVVDPRTQSGAATLQPTGIHHEQARPVDRRFGGHRVHERDIVDAVAQVREEFAHILAAVAALTEFPARLDDAALILVPAAAKRFHFDRLAVHADHLSACSRTCRYGLGRRT